MDKRVQVGVKLGMAGAALLLLAACTGRGGGAGSGGLVIAAKRGAFEFVPANISAPVGSNQVTLQNPDSQAHDWTIDSIPIGGSAQKIHVHADPGKNASQTFAFSQAGVFKFYCSLPGHAEAGMVGQLTVQ
ncbi:MAG: cupredoxin domain-containing protein [Dehalococcoidia bacterium]